MDIRDSSSLFITAVNRDDSSSAAEEDGALSVTAALAKEATSLFQLGKYAECVDVLNQLNQKKQDDPKVLHNIAIAEYYRDGCSVPKRLLDVLHKVKKRSEELAQASGEQVEAVGNLGSKVNLVSKGNNAIENQISCANSAKTVYMNEFETSIATLNNAIIWFSLHEYTKALSVLEPLFQNIEPIDEIIALHVCFLLLDAGLACNDASKSADVLLYMEKAFDVSGTHQSDSGGLEIRHFRNLVSKPSPVLSSSFNADPSNADLGSGINASENPLSRTLSDETSEYESMLSTLDIGGQNLSRPAGFSASDDLSRNAVSGISMSNIDLKLKLQLYKVRFLLLTRNLKHAKREAKLTMNIARSRDSSMALLVKAQLEYARGNYRKAIKLMVASSNQTETGILSMFNNNLGCIYYQLGSYNIASVFFSRALSNCKTLRKDKPLKLSTLSEDNSVLISYNCGVQYLACGKPMLAARCFQKAVPIFYNRPLLWIRLAECCLMALNKGLPETKDAESSRSELRLNVIGKGKWRHLVLEDGFSRNGEVESKRRDNGISDDDKQPKLSMSIARQYLVNALYLLEKSELSSNSATGEIEASETSNFKTSQSIDPKGSSVIGGLNQSNANGDAKEQRGSTVQELIQNSLSCYKDIIKREKLSIKPALLANIAFVELELENPLKALNVARTLLELPECSRIYIFLGHIYAAEALCLLNRPKDAAEHLLAYLTGGKDFGLPFSQEDYDDQCRADRSIESEDLNGGGSVAANNSSTENPNGVVFLKPEEAQAALYTNFATIYAVQGELEEARKFVTKALSIIPESRQATMTAVYIDLVSGKSQEAIARLKQCSSVRFISRGLTLSKS